MSRSLNTLGILTAATLATGCGKGEMPFTLEEQDKVASLFFEHADSCEAGEYSDPIAQERAALISSLGMLDLSDWRCTEVKDGYLAEQPTKIQTPDGDVWYVAKADGETQTLTWK